MFSFNPLSDAEINSLQNRDLLPDGVYPFVVETIDTQNSKSGNLMLKVRIGVFKDMNDKRSIIDYLVPTDQMMFKLKHFCESIGLIKEYENGSFVISSCINRTGKVRIGVQKGSAKIDGTGFYPDKNSVKDYVKAEEKVVKNPVVDSTLNDDIAF